jgi:P-type Cu+ transporter
MYVHRSDALRIAGAALAIVLVWFGLLSDTAVIAVSYLAVLACGYPTFRLALTALVGRRMSMELSMSIAVLAALFVGEYLTALVIVFFVLIAEELEHQMVARGRSSIKSLIELMPRSALLKRGAEYDEVDIAHIKAGDIVLVKPGSRVVVDGVVVSGHTFVDEATITGESLPVEKVVGSAVFAGTINQSGAIEVRTDRIGADTAFGKIIESIEQAEHTKADVQRISDRIAGYLVLFSIVAAAITFALTRDIQETISVIIVSGACGIAAGTPLAILGSIGRAARRNSIVKGGLYLERLAQIDTVVFDKTGTLTYGRPHVAAVLPVPGETPHSVLQAAASAEGMSEHPLARAILDRASEMDIRPKQSRNFSYTPGRGISCDVDDDTIVVGNRALMVEKGVRNLPGSNQPLLHVSEVMIARNGRLIGRVHISDTIRPEAKQAIAELHRMRIRTLMLTGDASAVASVVAKNLGIDQYVADLRPEQKRQHIIDLQKAGRVTAMIGDGVNDAPALTEAAVGVAVGSATDVALESADVVLIGNDMMRFVETVQIARQCQRVIYFNVWATLTVDAVGMALAMMGMLNPMLAAFIHVGSEVVLLLNSARMMVMKRR